MLRSIVVKKYLLASIREMKTETIEKIMYINQTVYIVKNKGNPKNSFSNLERFKSN